MKSFKSALYEANGSDAHANLDAIQRETAEHDTAMQDLRAQVRGELGKDALYLTPATSQLASAHAEAALVPHHVEVRDLTPDAQPIRVSVAA